MKIANGRPRWSTMKRTMGQAAVALLCLLVLPSVVEAHAGVGGEDVRGPMAVSGALAIASYFVVLHWPRRRKANKPPQRPDRKWEGGDRGRRTYASRHSSLKDVRHLKQVSASRRQGYEPN
jgi:hypothetical protein